MGSILICNYGPAGNYIGQKPYKSGTTCSQCEEGTTCVNKLCQGGSRKSDLSFTPDDSPVDFSKASLRKPSVNFVIFLGVMVIIGSHLC